MIANDTKSKILSIAIELFALQGYEKTTMRSIAEKVGIRSASIYYFFSSKESILNTIFLEFESNFTKYRNKVDDIMKAAEIKPISETLSMLFYSFGSLAEHNRMMAISRIVISLQYENIKAQELYQRVLIQNSMDYIVEVLKGLYNMGRIKNINFKWIAFIFISFSTTTFQENLRHTRSYLASSEEYEEGIKYLCSKLAEIIEN